MEDKPFFLLAADDDADDRYMLELVIKNNCPNWVYKIVHHGEALLEYLVNLPETLPEISLILLDINMPLKNGIETLKELKSNSRYEHLPVVGYSTANDKSSKENFLKAGGIAYLQKPDQMDQIEAVILKLPEIAESKI